MLPGRRSPRLAMLAAPCVLALTSPVLAGSLHGQVLGPDGAPLADIRLQVRSAAAGVALETRTGADGSYRLANLPPAVDYVIRVAEGADAYAAMVQDRVVVREQEVARESFRLFPSILELIRVRAAQEGPLVDLGEIGTRTLYTDEFLAGLPVTCSR